MQPICISSCPRLLSLHYNYYYCSVKILIFKPAAAFLSSFWFKAGFPYHCIYIHAYRLLLLIITNKHDSSWLEMRHSLLGGGKKMESIIMYFSKLTYQPPQCMAVAGVKPYSVTSCPAHLSKILSVYCCFSGTSSSWSSNDDHCPGTRISGEECVKVQDDVRHEPKGEEIRVVLLLLLIIQ